MKITFEDKVAPQISDDYKITSNDINEIKNVINTNDSNNGKITLIGDFTRSSSDKTVNLTDAITNYKSIIVYSAGYGWAVYDELNVEIFKLGGKRQIIGPAADYYINVTYINNTSIKFENGSSIQTNIRIYGVK